MSDYSAYTIEGAFCILILAIAHKIYKMRCDSSSHCCGESLNFTSHNSGEGQSTRAINNDEPQNNV